MGRKYLNSGRGVYVLFRPGDVGRTVKLAFQNARVLSDFLDGELSYNQITYRLVRKGDGYIEFRGDYIFRLTDEEFKRGMQGAHLGRYQKKFGIGNF